MLVVLFYRHIGGQKIDKDTGGVGPDTTLKASREINQARGEFLVGGDGDISASRAFRCARLDYTDDALGWEIGEH